MRDNQLRGVRDESVYCEEWVTDHLEQAFPEVLRHESEHTQQGPTKGVKASESVVWIFTCIQTGVTLRTHPEHIIISIIIIITVSHYQCNRCERTQPQTDFHTAEDQSDQVGSSSLLSHTHTHKHPKCTCHNHDVSNKIHNVGFVKCSSFCQFRFNPNPSLLISPC